MVLKHEVPLQHQIERMAGTRSLSEEEKSNFMKLVKKKSGSFDAQEDQIIRNNWKNFCKVNQRDSHYSCTTFPS